MACFAKKAPRRLAVSFSCRCCASTDPTILKYESDTISWSWQGFWILRINSLVSAIEFIAPSIVGGKELNSGNVFQNLASPVLCCFS